MGRKRRQAGLIDGLGGFLAALALGLESEVDDENAVLFDDADEEDDADDGDDAEVLMEEHEGEQRADARRGQRGEDGDGMDEALIEDAEHDVNGDEGGEDQEGLIGERVVEGSGGALEVGLERRREVHLLGQVVDLGDGGAERGVGREIEGDGDRGELALVIDGEQFGGAAACA